MIAKLFIPGTTRDIPKVEFFGDTGILNISGAWMPHSGIEAEIFYQIENWLKEYILLPAAKTILNVKMTCYGTAPSKYLLKIFKNMDSLFLGGKSVEINWFYEHDDQDIMESGEEYKEFLKLPFNLVEII
jgi:hypothetical protein